MKVEELVKLLEQFPPQLPVYFCPHSNELDDDHAIVAPTDAVMNLVAMSRQSAMGFKSSRGEASEHFDALVIYPINVRDTK